jgi:NAD-dependent DNA ligase
LLNGLGIPGVGKKTAIDVIKAVNSEKLTVNNLEDLIKVMGNEEFLRSVYGVGEKIVEGIIHFMKHNKALLRRLEAYGVNFDASKYVEGMLDEENTK